MAKRAAKGDAKRAVLYVRVSTEEQNLGPEAQRAAAQRWCDARGVALVCVCEDLGVSGGAPLDECPGLLASLDALAAHGAGVLLVAKRDRLARDVMKAAMVESLAAGRGATIESAAGEGEGSDPAALLMRRMVDAFAEYERALIRSRTRAALRVKATRGERVGSVPYGKRLAADGVHLEDSPDELAVLVEIRALRDAGLSLRAIGRELNARGVTLRGLSDWTHANTVARALSAAA
jgi:DNA invertase Pin-like site-specific DNA recombinase